MKSIIIKIVVGCAVVLFIWLAILKPSIDNYSEQEHKETILENIDYFKIMSVDSNSSHSSSYFFRLNRTDSLGEVEYGRDTTIWLNVNLDTPALDYYVAIFWDIRQEAYKNANVFDKIMWNDVKINGFVIDTTYFTYKIDKQIIEALKHKINLKHSSNGK